MTPQDIFDRFGGYDPNALAFDPAAGCEPEEHLIYPSLRTCTVNITNEDDDFQREHEDILDSGVPLVDAANIQNTPISSNFKVKEVTASGYFRLHPGIVNCLQGIRKLGAIAVDYGYLASSQLETAPHVAEDPYLGFRHMSGLAVMFKQSAPLKKTAGAAFTICSKLAADAGYELGLVLYSDDHVYVDFRPVSYIGATSGASVSSEDFAALANAAARNIKEVKSKGVPQCTETPLSGTEYPANTEAIDMCGPIAGHITFDNTAAILDLVRLQEASITPREGSQLSALYVSRRLSTRLAVLLALLDDRPVSLSTAWRPDEELPLEPDSFELEARALTLHTERNSNISDAQLAQLARCAGFDHIQLLPSASGGGVRMCVRQQDGFVAATHTLGDASFLTVTAPLHVAEAAASTRDPHAVEMKMPLHDGARRFEEVVADVQPEVAALRGYDSAVPLRHFVRGGDDGVLSRYFRLHPLVPSCFADAKALHDLRDPTQTMHLLRGYERIGEGAQGDGETGGDPAEASLPTPSGRNFTRRHASGRALEVTALPDGEALNPEQLFAAPPSVNLLVNLTSAIVGGCSAAASRAGFTMTLLLLPHGVYVDFVPKEAQPGPLALVHPGVANVTLAEYEALVAGFVAREDDAIFPAAGVATACSLPAPQGKNRDFR